MEKFTTITSKVIPVAMQDVDTDLILPAQFLTSISRDGYGQNLFRRLRDSDANFPFNQEKYKDARILVVDDNFGCGSSREHAVWALYGWGIRAIIGKSFADIFAGNSAKNGLLLVTMQAMEVDKLLADAKNGEYTITVDLENQQVSFPDGRKVTFGYDSFRKHCLINGLDDIDYIRSFASELEQFRKNQEKEWTFSTLAANN
jgi:3-isopropylmalate/(R)-2-methylmalate dehydratase small subunit